MTLQINKTYKTREGNTVNILGTGRLHHGEIFFIGLVDVGDVDVVGAFNKDGTYIPRIPGRLNPSMDIMLTDTFIRLDAIEEALAKSGNVMAAQSYILALPRREIPRD